MNNTPFSPELVLFLTKLPAEPGIYKMLDEAGHVLYVGKASHLKKRVSSYFNQKKSSPKTRSLVSQIKSVDIAVTRSETEALLLESHLIKTLRPKYNILMRDDKSYPYIHISNDPDFPRIEMYRCKKKPATGLFFGPYPSGKAVKETILIIQKVFKLRTCRDSYFKARSRPCLQYQIKRCTAPCVDYISPQQYLQSVADAIKFLQGKSQAILEELADRMAKAVTDLKFEEAAIFRDQIKSLRLVQEQQGIMRLSGDVDAIALEVRAGFACIQCVTIREGQILASHAFFPSVPHNTFDEELTHENLWQQTFDAFIGHYYLDTPDRIPDLIITHHALADHAVLEAALTQQRGKRSKIKVNPRGTPAGWMDFALNNLRISIADHNAKHSTIKSRYQALEQVLSLTNPIVRMECFDISHTQGAATIASCVVFDAQGPCIKEYRRFNIEGITPGDDYAAMEQAITRRFKRLVEIQSLPSVLVIDGGKGQVGVASRVLSSLNIAGVMLLGVVKGPGRKAGLDKLILANASEEFILSEDSRGALLQSSQQPNPTIQDPSSALQAASPQALGEVNKEGNYLQALHLLQHIRDEAHRFAITAHRQKRHKVTLDSTLEDIEGIGAKRRQALLHRFGGLRELAKAPLEEIAKVQGISDQLAGRIFVYFHGE